MHGIEGRVLIFYLATARPPYINLLTVCHEPSLVVIANKTPLLAITETFLSYNYIF